MKGKIIIGIIVVIALIYFFSGVCITGNCATEINEHDEFAKYLTEQGISMAGTDRCGNCNNQKELFGDSFQYIEYHNCDSERNWCLDHNIQGYPTWIFPDGNQVLGTQSIEKLKDLSGYKG